MRIKRNVLFISYDGLTDHLGHSQIMPYFIEVAKKDDAVKFFILSYEKPNKLFDVAGVNKIKHDLEVNKIKWVMLRYHKNPKILSTVFDILVGIYVCIRLIRNYQISIIHVRSYVPAAIALFFKKTANKKFIFDMRGFWADERVEGGIWPKGYLYRFAKYLEKLFLLNADTTVTLTEEAKKEINSFEYFRINTPRIYVIPTCVDLTIFDFNRKFTKDSVDEKLFLEKFIFVYVGSLSTWYEVDGLYDFFLKAKGSIDNAHLLLITKESELAVLKMKEAKIDRSDVTILEVEHNNIPRYLNKAKVGLAFYKPGYSRKGCCPTKIGEYLACGLPLVINAGIGDMDRVIGENNIGAVIAEFNESEYVNAVNRINDLWKDPHSLRLRCRLTSDKYFSLNIAIERYRRIYGELL